MLVAERSRGFTLLEVLVAFTLCAFVLAAALQVFSTGLGGASASQRHVVATMMAQSKLAELESDSPPAVGRQSGTTDDGYRWQSDVERYTEANADDLVNTPVVLYQLSVEVTWGGQGRERTVTLTTLRVAQASDDLSVRP
jgi:prepilin-type N-terminal cleavage/methylation domain